MSTRPSSTPIYDTELGGTIVIPAKLTTIGPSAFKDTKLTGLDLSKAASLVEIGYGAFYSSGLAGKLVIPPTVTKIGSEAFWNTELTGLDLSKATSLVEIGDSAFSNTNLKGTTIGSEAF